MSSPTFSTLPREIRDRIYDFVWDLGQTVSPSLSLLRGVYDFNNLPADVVLALLRVNHQISSEAASTFYGKRKFYLSLNLLSPFLEGIALRRHLIKDVEVHDQYNFRFPFQTFELFQDMDALRSFTMTIKQEPFNIFQERLADSGIYKITDRTEIIVHSERKFAVTCREYGIFTHHMEFVALTNIWTCAKGEREWKSRGFHCMVEGRMLNDLSMERANIFPSQPCHHDHHRQQHY